VQKWSQICDWEVQKDTYVFGVAGCFAASFSILLLLAYCWLAFGVGG